MKTLFWSIAVAGLVVTVTGCAMTEKSLREKGQAPMTQQQLQDMYAQPRKVAWTNDRNQSGTAAYTPDGVGRVEWPGGGATGKYRIVDGKFCSTYAAIRNGVETCFTVYQLGPKEMASFFSDGSFNATSRLLE
jgi:hypothetical protein